MKKKALFQIFILSFNVYSETKGLQEANTLLGKRCC